MNYENFIRSYLEFYPEYLWDKCIYHIMHDIEYWNHNKCIKFADKLRRERLSEKERCIKCNDILHEYEILTCICDNCDYKESLCDSPNTPTKGSESSRND